MTRPAVGRDYQSRALGGDHNGDSGTSTTAPTATAFTADGKSYTVDSLRGHVVVRGTTYGVVLSNTATVLTIDKWYNPADPGGAAAATPAAGAYIILGGQAPARWMGVSANTATVNDADTDLTGEITSGTLTRVFGAYAHTTGASTYTVSNTFTSDQTVTLGKAGIFPCSRLGQPLFLTLIPSPPALVSGDLVAVTDTVTI